MHYQFQINITNINCYAIQKSSKVLVSLRTMYKIRFERHNYNFNVGNLNKTLLRNHHKSYLSLNMFGDIKYFKIVFPIKP